MYVRLFLLKNAGTLAPALLHPNAVHVLSLADHVIASKLWQSQFTPRKKKKKR